MSAATVEFFFSFRSPYSYLAVARAFALVDRFDVDLAYRGVIPMAMRGQSVPRSKRMHTVRDVKREADRLGIPFGRLHDPIGEGARRCLLVGEHAVDVGGAREFVVGAATAIWSQAVDVARDDGLRPLCERAGLEWAACRAALADPALEARVEANTDRLIALGHWGVPLFVLDGELFWGQDRLEDVERALAARGAEREAPARAQRD